MNLFARQSPNPALTRSRSPSPAPPPVPPMRFQKNEINHSITNQPIFTVTAEKSSLSGKKSMFTLHRHWTARPLGSFRFSSMDPSKIEYEVNGIARRMSDDSLLFGSKWSMSPVSFPNKRWLWKRKDKTFTLSDDAGLEVATVVDGNLVLKPLGFHELAVDEAVLCAYAMWQKQRRDKGDAEDADIAGEIVGALVGG